MLTKFFAARAEHRRAKEMKLIATAKVPVECESVIFGRRWDDIIVVQFYENGLGKREVKCERYSVSELRAISPQIVQFLEGWDWHRIFPNNRLTPS